MLPVSLFPLLWSYVGAMASLVVGGLYADLRYNKRQEELTDRKQQALADITRRYNEVTQSLIYAYRQDKVSLSRQSFFGTGSRRKESLRRQYEQKYLNNKSAYESAIARFQQEWYGQKDHRTGFETFWKWLIAIGLLSQMAMCTFVVGAGEQTDNSTEVKRLADDGSAREWTAADIPMPHLSDGSRYVSNPDGVVSAETERRLNLTLRKMDDSLGIESAVVIVRRIENKDIFRFSQDLFDHYHIGKDDRGLVMVLAYDDHLFRTHTGRSLEGDLTDAECFHLQERYVIPSMREAMPDSGMIYMVEGLYDTLLGKELPEMSTFKGSKTDDDFPAELLLFIMMPLVGWAGLVIYLAGRYGWAGTAATRFMANPFPAPVTSDVNGWFGGGGGGFGGGFSGGGGGFSGGFSGGSSGGGGATSSW